MRRDPAQADPVGLPGSDQALAVRVVALALRGDRALAVQGDRAGLQMARHRVSVVRKKIANFKASAAEVWYSEVREDAADAASSFLPSSVTRASNDRLNRHALRNARIAVDDAVDAEAAVEDYAAGRAIGRRAAAVVQVESHRIVAGTASHRHIV